MTNNISNINNKKSILNKNKNNKNIVPLNNTLRSKKVLTWERSSLDSKRQNNEKIKISVNNNVEKLSSNRNNLSKKNPKILSGRPNSFMNNQKHKTIYSINTTNAAHIIQKNKKNPSTSKIENHINKLTFSNPNLV